MNLYTVPLSRTVKQMLMMLADCVMLGLALWLSFALLGVDFFARTDSAYLYFAIANVASVLVFLRIGLYRAILLYIGPQSGFIVLQGVTISTAMLALTTYFFVSPDNYENSLFPIYWMISLLFVGGSRFVAKVALQNLIQNFRPKEPVIIYGAGSSGMQLVVALQSGDQYLPVAFVDDSRSLIGSTVHGIRVYSPGALFELIENFSVRQLLLAVPSATHAERKEILNRLEHLPVHVKTVPDLFDMVSGKMGVDEVRDIDIEDLLGRDIVPPNPKLMGACITGCSVMVTGAAGSIGSELCRQILLLRPARLILVDSFEYGLYTVENELLETIATLKEAGEGIELVALLGNVCNPQLMEHLMKRFAVATVYHVAAYKQVPMVESNIIEGVQNNIFGTLVSAQAAERSGVANFVLISTDKAVRPTNFMGATKRFAEQLLQAMAYNKSSTRFSMVRFGNVLGSSGSVVPLFRRQISMGGPVTVTHPEVTRYFMTVQEAAQLVIQAGSMATGGDVFVLDMHDPIRIVDLARKMVHLMGYDVRDENSYKGDIAIEYTGLRPGEKLFEELLIGESVTGTDHPKIMRAEEDALSWTELEGLIHRLQAACKRMDLHQIREILMQAVDGFEPKEVASDPLWDLPVGEQSVAEKEGEGRKPENKITTLYK